VTITVGNTTFDYVDYDADADVLYLHVGDPATAVDFDESPEGHGLRFDAQRRLVGITVVGVREVLRRDGRLVITVPARLEVDSRELAAIIDAA
jgi:uncharacterized protein YuzE